GIDQPPAEFADKRQKVLARMHQFEDDTAKIVDLLHNDDVIANLRSDKVANLEFLKKEHGVTQDMLDALYAFARFHYACGNYADAADLLYKFRVLSTDNDRVADATWGKFACEMLSTNWE